jgi:hypothetical protein
VTTSGISYVFSVLKGGHELRIDSTFNNRRTPVLHPPVISREKLHFEIERVDINLENAKIQRSSAEIFYKTDFARYNYFRKNNMVENIRMIDKVVNNLTSQYWDATVYNGQYGPVAGGTNTLNNNDLNEATQKAYDYILKNYKEGGKVVIYGYSYGGVLALYLEKRLEESKIKANFVVTVDAAAGPDNKKVKRIVSNNTDENLNIYQTTPSGVGSRGDKNEREDGTENGITNEIKVFYLDKNGKIQQMTHSTIGEQTTEEVVNEILTRLKKKDGKK